MSISRRSFVGGVAAAVGALGWRPEAAWAQQAPAAAPAARGGRVAAVDYDKILKLSANENNYGPSESVMNAMIDSLKYAGRYGAPDGGLVEAIATHHGVKAENILLGAGSGEILDVVGNTFLSPGRKVIGVEPSYSSVYGHATSLKADAIKLALTGDYRQDIGKIIETAKANAANIGFVYICNPNNPTGVVVSKAEVDQLMAGLPPDVPVLMDEAYHHFVEDPAYATSVPHVIAGRPIVITRTFSKIAALAGMRLGYAIAPKALIDRMRPNASGSINIAVKRAGVASLADTAGMDKARSAIIATRKKVSAELTALGYPVIPSQANFFMVSVGREVQPVIQEFRTRGIMVGRPFPPMTQHLRVSVGTDPEMARFLDAFKEVFPAKKAGTASGLHV